MMTLSTILLFVHLIGLALGVGASTVKLVLLFKCKSDHDFVSVFLKVIRPVTKVIITGLILVTISGVCWIFYGYSFTPLLIVKVTLVGLIWILGPIIDNVIEPKYKKAAPLPGETGSYDFVRFQKMFLLLEMTATGLFYVILLIGVLL